MIISICPQTVLATGTEGAQDSGVTIGTSGLCEHHTEHTEDCGYTEGTPETPCTHEHTPECYPDSVSGNEATPTEAAEPTNCTHTEHDDTCGYAEGTPETPCGYVCEICPVQTLIDALPDADEITAENAENVGVQLTAIDDAMTAYGFGDEEKAQLDFSKYDGAVAALNALAGMAGANTPMLMAANAPTVLQVNGADILQATDNTVTCGQGTAVYEATTNTLTLTNATIDSGTTVGYGDRTSYGIYAVKGDLNIVLAGTNIITSPADKVFGRAINVEGKLSISGGGNLSCNVNDIGIIGDKGLSITDVSSLKVNSAGNNYQQDPAALHIGDNVEAAKLEISNSTVKLNAPVGINLNQNCTMEVKSQSNLTISPTYGYAVIDRGNVLGSISDSTVNINGTGGFNVQGLEISSGNVSVTVSEQYAFLLKDSLTISNSQVTVDSTGAGSINSLIYNLQHIEIKNNSQVNLSSKHSQSGIACTKADLIVDNSTLSVDVSESSMGYYAISVNDISVSGNSDVTGKRSPSIDYYLALRLATGGIATIKPKTGGLLEIKTGDNETSAQHITDSPFSQETTISGGIGTGSYPYIRIKEHTHAGGTATCTSEAICTDCGRAWGNKLPHTWGNPVFTWAEDGSACTATFTCSNAGCSETQNVTANVTSQVTTQPTSTNKGVTTYTATVTFNGSTHTDTKEIADIPILKYTVTIQTEGSGTASASPTTATQGTKITLTATPGSGYRFKEWVVVSGGVTISGNEFTMPDSDVTVKAVFEADGGGGSDPHSHTFESGWTSDSSGHWHKATCEHTGEKGSFAAHTPGAAATSTTPQTCTVCGYVITPATGGGGGDPHTHTFESGWTSDSSGHWHKATCEHTGEKGSFAAHTPGAAATSTTPQTCIVCGYVIAPATGGSGGGGDPHTHSGGTATCQSPATCAGCGQTYGSKDPNNHTGGTEVRGAYPETTTQNGYTGDTYCLGCGVKLSTGSTISATGGGGGGGDDSPSYDYFIITAKSGVGGKISPSGRNSVREGSNKTYIITPDDGYGIADVLVDGKSVGAVGRYTFKDVQKAHTIEARFVKAEKPNPGTGGNDNPNTGGGNPFTDVSETDWFYEDALFVHYMGIMVGTSDTTFSPNLPTTRGMMATILWRMEGSPAPSGSNPFTDVPASEYYTTATTWANEQSIYAGYGNQLFGPNDPITREQLAAIFYRYAAFKGCDLSPADSLDRFTDKNEVADWAQDAVKWAVGSGLMYGTSNTTFSPKAAATRAQIAAMLHRFIEQYGLVEQETYTGLMGWVDPKSNYLKSPKTGDHGQIGRWAGMTLFATVGGAGTLVYRRRREHSGDAHQTPTPA